MIVLLLSYVALTLAQDLPNEGEQPIGNNSNDLNEDEETALLMKEWETYMNDFVPADLITFEISGRAEEEFFEEIMTVPSFIRGAYFVSSSESQDIDITILDPLKNVVYQKAKRKEGIFYFDAKRRGTYSFIFKNSKYLGKKAITFALHCGNSTDEVLQSDHLDPFETRLKGLQRSVKDFQTDQKFASLRQESHLKTVADANNYVFWFSLLECVGVIAVTSWQVYYIKKLLDNRRII